MISYVKRIERIRIIVGLLLFFGALCCYCLNISASEQVTGSLQTVTEDIVAYDSMDVSSGRVDIKAGEIILVADEDSEWLHVLYQGSNLYIKKTDASARGIGLFHAGNSCGSSCEQQSEKTGQTSSESETPYKKPENYKASQRRAFQTGKSRRNHFLSPAERCSDHGKNLPDQGGCSLDR